MNIFDALHLFNNEAAMQAFLASCLQHNEAFVRRLLAEAHIPLSDDTKLEVTTSPLLNTPAIFVTLNKKENVAILFSNEAQAHIVTTYRIVLCPLASGKETNILSYRIFLQPPWPLEDAALQLLFSHFQQKLEEFYKPLQLLYTCEEKEECANNWRILLHSLLHTLPQYTYTFSEGTTSLHITTTKDTWQSSLHEPFSICIEAVIPLLAKEDVQLRVRFDELLHTRFLSRSDAFTHALLASAHREHHLPLTDMLTMNVPYEYEEQFMFAYHTALLQLEQHIDAALLFIR